MFIIRIFRAIINGINAFIEYLTKFLMKTALYIPFLYCVLGIILYIWFDLSFKSDPATGKMPLGTVFFYLGLVASVLIAFGITLRRLYNKLPTKKDTTHITTPTRHTREQRWRGRTHTPTVPMAQPTELIEYNGRLYAPVNSANSTSPINQQSVPHSSSATDAGGRRKKRKTEYGLPIDNSNTAIGYAGYPANDRGYAPAPMLGQPQTGYLGLDARRFAINGDIPVIYPHNRFANIVLFEYRDRVLCYRQEGGRLEFMKEIMKQSRGR